MPLKLKIRNISRPICQGLENALERAGKRGAAQRFRQIQHERFGLSNSEWEGLRSYFIYDELIWISRQRGASFWYMIEDIMQTPGESRAEEYESLCAIFMTNKRERQVAIDEFETARKRIKKSPIYRAMKSRRQCKDWHMADWLVSRCRETGGCCARQCGCCKILGYGTEEWKGHCAPACTCCQKDKGLRYPIDLDGYGLVLPFNINPEDSDVFSRRVMDAYVWGLGIETE